VYKHHDIRVMELTYTIRAADGQTFGPASQADVLQWIREGRVAPAFDARRSDMQDWAPVSAFEEFKNAFPPVPPPPSAQPSAPPTVPSRPPAPKSAAPGNALALAQARACGSWFYWVAGLSLVNSIAALSGSGIRFLFGLGITQIIDGIATRTGSPAIGIILDILATSLFVFFGLFAMQGKRWAFLIGGILFGLDGLLLLLAADWLSILFHAWVLYRLAQGFSACPKN